MAENVSTFHFTTTSPQQTEALGAALAKLLPAGTLLALRGDLAAGKTCFVHGLAKGLGVEGQVSSPTFTLINEYRGETTLYHLDLYRLDSIREIIDLGLEEMFEDPEGICAVEWAERMESILPERRVDIQFEHVEGDARRIKMVAHGHSMGGWQAALEHAIKTAS